MTYTNQRSLLLACLIAMASASDVSPELTGVHATNRELNVFGKMWNSTKEFFAGDDDDDDDGENNDEDAGVLDSIGGLIDEGKDLVTDWIGGEEGDGIVCALVDKIGISEAFEIGGNCDCDGDLDTGITLQCNFEECAPDSDVCGKIDMKFTAQNWNGPFEMTACADFEDDEYRRTCFQYLQANGEQTCSATYGGQDCECSIDKGLCLSVDCSRYLPGASVDTCQFLSMEDDSEGFLPDFAIFRTDYEQRADAIRWDEIDLANLDFDNFDIRDVQWDGIFETENWVDLIGNNPTFQDASQALSSGTCEMMYQAAGLADDLDLQEKCDCGFDDDKAGLKLSCNLGKACTDENNEMCGWVHMNMTYANVREVHAEVCTKYQRFPETCYSYGVPLLDVPNTDLTTMFLSDCEARYGNDGNKCKCTMDKNWCLSVDCSEFEPMAVTDTCKVMEFTGTVDNPSKVMLQLRTPERFYRVSDGEGGTFERYSSGTSTSVAFAMATTFVVAVVGQIW